MRRAARAEERYGVDRDCWRRSGASNSNFGKNFGKRPLVQSLATLACLASAPDYFRGELMATLKILDRGDIAPDKLNGSWAGAFGQTQFMPSTFLRLAVDLDGDGRRDIVGSAADSLGSTAQLSAKSGWRTGVPWGFEVSCRPAIPARPGRKAKLSMAIWAARGVTRLDGGPLGEGEAGLLLPAGGTARRFW